jgi:hypothetical protein
MATLGHVATFVIETYQSRARPGELELATDRLREAVAAASTVERPVHHVRSFFVPEDEMCFHVVEAPSLQTTVDVSRQAGLVPERIVEAEAAAG